MRELYARLKESGFEPWLDEEDLIAGQDWQAEIPAAVRQADIVLVCLSKTSITKEGYVQKEIKFALDAADEKPEDTIFVIPIRLEELEVPRRLKHWHWVDLFDQRGYEKLVLALSRRAQSKSISSITPGSPAEGALEPQGAPAKALAGSFPARLFRIVRRRRLWLVLGGAAVLGLGGWLFWVKTQKPPVTQRIYYYTEEFPVSEKALDPVQLLALIVAGWPPQSLAKMAQRDGVTFWPGNPAYLQHLRNAGANSDFVSAISLLSSKFRERKLINEALLSHLEKGGNLQKEGRLNEAGNEFDAALGLDPDNPALVLPLGGLQLRDWRPDPEERTVVASVDAGGKILLNAEPEDPTRLEARLVEIFKTRAVRAIFVQEAANRPFSELAQVISIAIKAGIDKIALAPAALGARFLNSKGFVKTSTSR